MRKISSILLITSLTCLLSALNGQEIPFSKGVNLTNWFQTSSAGQIQFTKYTKKDFEQIKSLGCDVIRLPINLHHMTNGAPNYNLDPLFIYFLDQVIDWAGELNIHLILDNHTFDPSENTDPNIGDALKKVWKQMATEWKDKHDKIYYEILNEPHGISDALWNNIQQEVIDVIRETDQKHTIIVGPAGWNSYNNLDAMPVYEDDNLIYTFHFYDPFVFTHQGATWTNPSMGPLSGVPFPYDAGKMPDFPNTLNGTWIQSAFNNYNHEGNASRVKQLIDIAAQFKEERDVPVFCGEFGVYIPNSDPVERVNWYQLVSDYLEEKGIAWTIWDYHGGFGIFEEGSSGLFDHDLNISMVEALGLLSPPQSPFEIMPDTAGFTIYYDYIGKGIREASGTEGQLNFYEEQNIYSGEFSIYWTEAIQYNTIGFDFSPDRDLSALVNSYYLEFYARIEGGRRDFDIRFVDTKTSDPNDHPWRSRVTVSESLLPGDGAWHLIKIPLEMFTEHGSWDNGQWYNPTGDFDWTKIDRMEFVMENGPLGSTQLWLDDIKIVDELGTTSLQDKPILSKLYVYPNPVSDILFLNRNELSGIYGLKIFDDSGKVLFEKKLAGVSSIDMTGYPKGIYFLELENEKTLQLKVVRVIKI